MTGTGTGPVSAALMRLNALAGRQSLTLGQLVEELDEAGLGLLLVLLALPSFIPTPGVPLGLVFGTAMSLVAGQVMLGRSRLSLPGWLAGRRVSARGIGTAVAWLAPHMRRVERRLRPRLAILTGRATRLLLAPTVLLLGVAILLPIPFGNQLPALAAIVLAFALICRDGLAVLAGLSLAVIALAWNAGVVFLGAEILGMVSRIV